MDNRVAAFLVWDTETDEREMVLPQDFESADELWAYLSENYGEKHTIQIQLQRVTPEEIEAATKLADGGVDEETISS